MKTKTDSQLLSEFVNSGTERAFEELVARHGRMVYAVCLRTLGKEHEAAEAAQAVFILLASKAPGLTGRETLSDWLYWASLNKARGARRSLARRRRAEKEAHMIRIAEEARRTKENHDLRAELDVAVASLPVKCRVPLVMAYLEGRPRKEIARELGVPLSTLQSRLVTGLERLRGRLSRRGFELSAGALAVLLAAEADVALPAGLMARLAATATADAAETAWAATAGASAKGFSWASAKLAAAALVIAVAGGLTIGGLRFGGGESLAGTPAPSPTGKARAGEILSASSFWRWHVTRKPLKEQKEKPDTGGRYIDPYPGYLRAPAPPEDWAQAAFDDSEWPRSQLLASHCRDLPAYILYDFTTFDVALRGKFLVNDPAAVGKLQLSLKYRGGVVAYLNGKEVARSDMPEGTVGESTLAKPYPDGAWLDSSGKLIGLAKIRGKAPPPPDALRDRTLGPVEIPAELLRKGVNVLAVQVRRAPYHEKTSAWDSRIKKHIRGGMYKARVWHPIDIDEIKLTASGAGAVPNVSRPAGIQIWTEDRNVKPASYDWGDPCEGIRPTRIVGARGGSFSGLVVVGSDKPILELKAEASALKSASGEVIPAGNVRILYAPVDYWKGVRDNFRWSDMVTEKMPEKVSDRVIRQPNPKVKATVTVYGAVAPVVVRVDVPREARAGDYRGVVTVSCQGLKPTEVPVELSVADYLLPEPKDFRIYADLYQSPTSLALYYKVPMWSEEHWKLIESSYVLLGRCGNKLLNIHAVDKTQFGNEHGYITWIRKKDGGYDWDFKVFDRLTDMAVKHCGKLDHVALHIFFVHGWKAGEAKQENTVTMRDEKTGKTEEFQVPVFGTAESKKFWAPYLKAVYDRLEKKWGLGEAMCVGTLCDGGPPPEVVKAFDAIWPGKGGKCKWMRGCHVQTQATEPYGIRGHGGLVVLHEFCYGGGVRNPNLHEARNYPGAFYYRANPGKGEHGMGLSLWRSFPLWALFKGTKGVGRICLDYWDLGLNLEHRFRERSGDVYNRYPRSTVRQRRPMITKVGAPGPEGTRSTLRIEAFIEGMQEAEAMITLSEAFTVHSAKLGPELTDRCRKAYEARKDFQGFARFASDIYEPTMRSDNPRWQAINRELFAAAGAAARKLGRQ
jgi:RNA polymerase sigma factor (sigma-70 family)